MQKRLRNPRDAQLPKRLMHNVMHEMIKKIVGYLITYSVLFFGGFVPLDAFIPKSQPVSKGAMFGEFVVGIMLVLPAVSGLKRIRRIR